MNEAAAWKTGSQQMVHGQGSELTRARPSTLSPMAAATPRCAVLTKHTVQRAPAATSPGAGADGHPHREEPEGARIGVDGADEHERVQRDKPERHRPVPEGRYCG